MSTDTEQQPPAKSYRVNQSVAMTVPAAGAIGFIGNEIAAQVRLSAGKRKAGPGSELAQEIACLAAPGGDEGRSASGRLCADP